MRFIDVDVFLEMERQIKEEGTVDRNMKTLRVLDDVDTNYAILSHRWADEVDYSEIMKLAQMENRNEIRERSGYQKIVKSCQQAENDGLEWLWVDTCCIDKRNSTELSEALNSMFRWYKNSKKCYAYLHDVDVFPSTPDHGTFAEFNGWPEWFSRGWTLQEMIPPTDLQFFNKDWQFIGDKRSCACKLEEITRVPRGVLEDGLAAYGPSIAQVMSWAADRETTRDEDRAYSLMGLLDVSMPMLYGEGKKAFLRLQQEIIRKSTDQTIFAWIPTDTTPHTCSVLADDPSLFRECHDVVQMDPNEFYSRVSDFWGAPDNSEDTGFLRRRKHFFRRSLFPRQWTLQNQAFHPFTVNNMGIQVQLPVMRFRGYPLSLLAALACKEEGSTKPMVIALVPWRTRCYRYTGEIKCDLTPTSYGHSQVILAYEGSGPSSGIVIEEADGVVASLLDQCAARSGTNVGNNDVDEHSFGVTCAEIHRIPGRWLQIFTSFTLPFFGRWLVFPFTTLCYAILPMLGAFPFCIAATTFIVIVWISLEASAGIPLTRLCTSGCSSRGEYIIGSGREIVVLRGRRPAVSSITHSETRIPSHALHDVRILVSLLFAMLAVLEGLAVTSYAAISILLLPQPLLLGILLAPVIMPGVLRRWSLLQLLYRLKLRKYTFNTRTSGVVFALLLSRTEKAEETEKVMNELLPTPNTRAWKKWKDIILHRIRDREDLVIGTTDWDDGTWTDREREMLVREFQHARDAYEVFRKYLGESVFEHPPV